MLRGNFKRRVASLTAPQSFGKAQNSAVGLPILKSFELPHTLASYKPAFIECREPSMHILEKIVLHDLTKNYFPPSSNYHLATLEFHNKFLRPILLKQSTRTPRRPTSLVPLLARCINNHQFNFPKGKICFFITSPKPYLQKKVFSIFGRTFSQNISNEKIRSVGKYSGAEIKRLLDLARPEKWKLSGAVCLLVISSAITMIVPFTLGKVIDIIYTSDPKKLKENLTKLSLALVGIFLVGGLCNFGRVYLISVAGQNITKRLREKVFTSVLNQELAFFDTNKTGTLVNRLSADTSLVSQALTTNISDGLRSGIMAVFGTSYMLYTSPELTAVGLSLLPIVAGVAVVYGRFVKKITKQVQDSLASASAVAEEKISNIRTVKAFANERREVVVYENKLGEVLKLAYKEALMRGIFFGFTGLSGNIIVLTILCYGGVLVSQNAMTVGSLTSFLLYAAYLGVSIGGLSSFYSEFNRSLGASTRLWEIVDREPHIPLSGGLYPEKEPEGSISFRNVSFSYPSRKDIPVLRNLNLDIPESGITAIVGASGSGKSTIASILLRLYDPDEGKILLDGINIEELSPQWIKRHIGFVSQEPVLFSGSIRENMLYGAPDPSQITMEQLEQAAQEANCYHFITKTFPQGFETKVGEKGVMLSGGQKQRIAIARALIKNPRILLLDEATSALDAESEHFVQEALERIMTGRTVLVIAHRLSSIKNSDQIVVLEKGEVAEKGTYQELIKLEEGAFKKLIKHQAFG